MSKQVASREPVVIEFSKEPLLDELDLPRYMKDYKKFQGQESAAKKNKKQAGAELLNILDCVGADTVVYKKWKATAVAGEPGTKLNLDKLRDNLMRVAKLDAELITVILEASTDPTEPRETYVRCTFGSEVVNGKS